MRHKFKCGALTSSTFELTGYGLWLATWLVATPLQFVHVLTDGLPGLIAGQKSLGDLLAIYNNFYGKEMHYSAFVIYMFLYWGVSRNWSAAGVTKTKNVVYSFSVMFLAISVFEFFWMYNYAVFQSQAWVIKWQMPQLRILLQNTMFLLAGSLGMFYALIDSYIVEHKEIVGRNWIYAGFRSWKLWILVWAGVAAALLWIYYPWPVHQFSVVLENGQVWVSSRLFPQTLYTVDVNPADGFNAGIWFYEPNNLIHGLNTLVKVIWAAVAYQAFKVKRA